MFIGQGAGQMPTASAVVADIIDMAVGRAQRTFQTLKLWSGQESDISLRPSETLRSRFYLRMMVEDRPGVLADVAGLLARHHISISSVIPSTSASTAAEGTPVPLCHHAAHGYDRGFPRGGRGDQSPGIAAFEVCVLSGCGVKGSSCMSRRSVGPRWLARRAGL